MAYYSSKGQITLKEDGSTKFVIKDYKALNSNKWYIITLFLGAEYPFVADSQSRLERELNFFEQDTGGVKKPKVISYNLEDKLLKREYIDGEIPYDKPELVSRALCSIHRAGYVVGDTKIENFLVDKSGVVSIIDAEQATVSHERRLMAWDMLLLFGSMAYKNIYDLDSYREAVKRIIDAYADWNIISSEIYNPLNAVLLAIIPPPHLLMLAYAINTKNKEQHA